MPLIGNASHVLTPGEAVLRSPACRVHMFGWESDTLHLTRAGWSLSMDQNAFDGWIQLAVHHPELGITGLSEISRWDWQRHLMENTRQDYNQLPVFQIQHFRHNLKVNVINSYGGGIRGRGFDGFQPVDGVPHVAYMDQIRSVEDVILFSPTRSKAKEIILPDDKEVKSMLDEILAKQQPKQDEIRERMRKEQRRSAGADFSIADVQPLMIHHASILSFASDRKAA